MLFRPRVGRRAARVGAQARSEDGLDLDGTPVIRTKSEVLNLAAGGFVTIEIPPIGGPAFRWFFCPVIEDPKDGAIASDAHLTIVELTNGQPLPAEREISDLFNCLQATGDECNPGELGRPFCGALDNSTGQSATLAMLGSANVAANDLSLRAARMPAGKPALFFAGTQTQNVPFADGRLCIAGPKLRFGQATATSSGGTLTRAIDFTSPPAADALVSGTTWHFQAWYRDSAGGPAGRNLSHGRSVTLQ